MLKADKPRTSAFLVYVNDDGTVVSIVHVFADAHHPGSRTERSK